LNFSVLTVHNDLLATWIALGELYVVFISDNIAWFLNNRSYDYSNDTRIVNIT